MVRLASARSPRFGEAGAWRVEAGRTAAGAKSRINLGSRLTVGQIPLKDYI